MNHCVIQIKSKWRFYWFGFLPSSGLLTSNNELVDEQLNCHCGVCCFLLLTPYHNLPLSLSVSCSRIVLPVSVEEVRAHLFTAFCKCSRTEMKQGKSSHQLQMFQFVETWGSIVCVSVVHHRNRVLSLYLKYSDMRSASPPVRCMQTLDHHTVTWFNKHILVRAPDWLRVDL